MWELNHKESWAPKTWCFWTVVLEKTLESPLDCKEIKAVNLKEISPKYSWLMLKLKLQYFGHLIQRANSLGKPFAGEDRRLEEKGTTEDEMVGWHHWLNGREFEQALGVGNGQGRQACCSPWGNKELHITEWLNWTDYMGNNKEQQPMAGLDVTVVNSNAHAHTSIQIYFFLFLFHCSQVSC